MFGIGIGCFDGRITEWLRWRGRCQIDHVAAHLGIGFIRYGCTDDPLVRIRDFWTRDGCVRSTAVNRSLREDNRFFLSLIAEKGHVPEREERMLIE